MQLLQSATTIEDYLSSMKRENPTEKHKDNVKGILERFVRFSKITNWNRVSQKEIFAYLDTLRKPEEIDPLHKWIGSYNFYITVLTKFSAVNRCIILS